MDEKTIAILIQKSEERYYSACMESLQGMKCPDGCQLTVHTIEKGDNFSEQMNAVLSAVQATYKIYLDERMYLISPDVVQNILDIFRDKSIGLIGFFGSPSMPLSGNIMDSPYKCGRVYLPMDGKIKEYICGEETHAPVSDVCYVLPTLFATQYDMEWDHRYAGAYYAVMTHCRKYDKQGWRIVVPVLEHAWCAYQGEDMIHDDLQEDRTTFFRMYHPYLDLALTDKDKNTLYACGDAADIPGWAHFSHPEGIRVGDRTRIHKIAICGLHFPNFEGQPRLVIGDDCVIEAYSTISAVHRIAIENFVHIAEGVHISDYAYDHQNLCLPPQYRSIVDGEVCIDRATRIEEHVVIRGNVRIGRGCLIRAGSVISSDVPDYCVVQGNPARVVEAFSAKSGAWVPVAGDEELDALLRERRGTPPIFTYALITYNRSKYLTKSLRSVLKQVGNDDLVEVLVSDNASTDDTREIVQQLQRKYHNLRYHCNDTNIGAEGNMHVALRNSMGEYVMVAGDDDYVADGALYALVDHLYRHRDCSLVYLSQSPAQAPLTSYESTGYLNYLSYIGFYITFISAIIMKRRLYNRIADPEKYNDTRIPQVYLQMEILKQEPSFSVLGSCFWEKNGEHSPKGYNLIEVFVKNYFDILTATVDIPPDQLSAEKKRVMEGMIYPWCYRIKHMGVQLSLDGIFEMVRDYYGAEPYYPEVIATLKQILGEDG